MKILVVGAGAIGGVTAAFMAKGGIDVTLVCKRKSTAEIIIENGLHIIGKRGEHLVKLKAVVDVSELEEKFDFCLIATKAYDLEDSALKALPYLKRDGLLVSLQNGICIDTLIKAVGKERAAGAVVTWSCTMQGDALLEITGEGGFILGMMGDKNNARILKLRDAMDKMAPTSVTNQFLSEIYSKLIINSGITCGGAMTGQTLGKMLLGKEARLFFISIVKEDIAVANAMHLTVPSFGGKLDYYKFIKGDTIFSELRRHAILFAVGRKYAKLKSSSLTALQRGGKTEVDTLNGWISEKGRELNVPTPVNDRVVKIIKEIEAGQRAMRPENLLETRKDCEHGYNTRKN